jgi:hypothetical protein
MVLKKQKDSQKLDKEIEEKLAKFEKNSHLKKEFGLPDNQEFNIEEEEETVEVETKLEKETMPSKKASNKTKIKQKPFFQDLEHIFADNFSLALDSFKKGFSSLFVGGKILSPHKLLILIFVFIPAILGGTIVGITGLILILLWILFMMFKKTSDNLQKIENNFKANLIPWRSFIKSDKKLSLSNKVMKFGTYTVFIAANGAMYILVKGVKIPIKSLGSATKIIGNITDKIGELLNIVAKTPAKLYNEAYQNGEIVINGISQSVRAKKRGPRLIDDGFGQKQQVEAKAQARTQAKEQEKQITRAKETTKELEKETVTKKIAEEKGKQAEITKSAEVSNQTKQAESAKQTNLDKQAELEKQKLETEKQRLETEKQKGLDVERQKKRETAQEVARETTRRTNVVQSKPILDPSNLFQNRQNKQQGLDGILSNIIGGGRNNSPNQAGERIVKNLVKDVEATINTVAKTGVKITKSVTKEMVGGTINFAGEVGQAVLPKKTKLHGFLEKIEKEGEKIQGRKVDYIKKTL